MDTSTIVQPDATATRSDSEPVPKSGGDAINDTDPDAVKQPEQQSSAVTKPLGVPDSVPDTIGVHEPRRIAHSDPVAYPFCERHGFPHAHGYQFCSDAY